MLGIVEVGSMSGKSFDITNQLKQIAHRGPDDEGVFYSNSKDVQIGQVRLSIIDTTSAGHQQIFDYSGRYVIVYNGEIYNYLELNKNLKINLAISLGNLEAIVKLLLKDLLVSKLYSLKD